jgi:hypothetical protein
MVSSDGWSMADGAKEVAEGTVSTVSHLPLWPELEFSDEYAASFMSEWRICSFIEDENCPALGKKWWCRREPFKGAQELYASCSCHVLDLLFVMGSKMHHRVWYISEERSVARDLN